MSEPPDANEPEAPSSEDGEPDAAPKEPAASEPVSSAGESPETETSAAEPPPATESEAAQAVAGEAREPEKPAVTEAVAPKKKVAKKKKKKRKAPTVPANAEPAAAQAADEPAEKDEPKPLPGLGTPDGEKLARAVRAFEAGNYALVRTLSTELDQAADADVKEYAKGLRRRIDVDPIQIVVLVACLALFLVIAYVYVLE